MLVKGAPLRGQTITSTTTSFFKNCLWKSWWRHRMETFSAFRPFVRGIHRSPMNSPLIGQWRGALMFFYLRLNKRLGKQWWGWWYETPSRPLWRHCNDLQQNRTLLATSSELIETDYHSLSFFMTRKLMWINVILGNSHSHPNENI